MELTAVIKGLEKISGTSVDIYTDSTYVKNGITKWVHGWLKNDWKTSNGTDVKNKDLWLRLMHLSQKVQVQWHWVKAHAGNVLNERADQLARGQAEEARVLRPALGQVEALRPAREPVPRSGR